MSLVHVRERSPPEGRPLVGVRLCLLVAGCVGLLVIGGFVVSGGLGLAVGTGSATDVAAQPNASASDEIETDDAEPTSVEPGADATEDDETPRHVDPDAYGEAGDAEGLADWYERQLADRFGEGSARMSEGDYERARELVDDEVAELVAEYVDLAEVTDRDDRVEEYATIQEGQLELAEAVEAYEERYEMYERAEAAGDHQRARQLARILEELAADVEETSAELLERYDETGAESEAAEFAESGETIVAVTEDIQRRQAEIRGEQFTPTQLSVSVWDESISYVEPLEATGLLVTEAGEPVANEEIQLAVGNQTVSATTDADGRFIVEYRPVDVPVDAEELDVAYEPAPLAGYSGSNATVPVSIEQVEASIDEPEVVPESAGFGDELRVESSIVVDGEPVEGVSLRVAIGGGAASAGAGGAAIDGATGEGGTAETVEADGGAIATNVTVPAAVEDGDRPVTVSMARDDRAVTASESRTTVTVTETETALSLSVEDGDDRVGVSGRLTADEAGVGNRTVDVAIDGVTAGAVETDADGAFNGTVVVPPGIDGGNVTVEASFDGGGTNLAGSSETATSFVPGAETGSMLASPVVWVVVGGVAVVIGAWWYRRRRRGHEVDGYEWVRPDVDRSAVAEAGGGVEPATLLSAAAGALADDRPATAIERAYAAARLALETRHEAPAGLTPWEFYAYCRERPDADDDEALRTVTDAYERASFDPAPVDDRTAKRVLTRTRRLCRDSRIGLEN
ncbi:hypothetical protein [Halovivax gelatinilyticus]|uniref:hypothetical protein n=1 Tax=Halovivax gelatinilyticus TaxID=2961597 RepID=UPI0020CA6D67|nr:hypothetical protein [Halovivax gelatinilyticus]